MNRSPEDFRYRFTAFDYIAMVGFSINMIVVAVIVVNWLMH